MKKSQTPPAPLSSSKEPLSSPSQPPQLPKAKPAAPEPPSRRRVSGVSRNEPFTRPRGSSGGIASIQPAAHESASRPSLLMAPRDIVDRSQQPPQSDEAGASPVGYVRPFGSVEAAQGLGSDGSTPSSPLGRVRGRHSVSADSDTTVRETTSPSLEAAFGSPGGIGSHPASTDSEDSNRTVRASAPIFGPSTARTPSYPFPYVPIPSSKKPIASLDESFIGLSPTVLSADARHLNWARDKLKGQDKSQESDLHASTPGDGNEWSKSESQFPAPNLYNTILQLNSELTLDAWWSCLVKIMRESYKVDRMSLALPVDPTDVEGIPWGQKLCYDASGLKAHPGSMDLSGSTRSVSSRVSEASEKSPAAPLRPPTRPPIETRHSYAGYETAKLPESEPISRRPTSSSRPSASRRVTAQSPMLQSTRSNNSQKLTSNKLASQRRNSDEYQSVENHNMRDDSQEEHHSMVHSNLCALDREHDPLLEPAGVNRLLERGTMVLLTRNFSEDEDYSRGKQPAELRDKEDATGQVFNKSRKSSLVEDPRMEFASNLVYEDYEQALPSPWSQSPAPSPAIQNDPEENPFFASAAVNEASFEPSSPKRDYNEYQSIEAIGIDNAYTVIHMPLIHPSLSKSFASEFHPPDSSSHATDEGNKFSTDMERKIPIAILSFSSSFVPYHTNLVQSLNDLGPHLATSFNTCLQNSNIQDRISKALRERHGSGQVVDFASTGLGLRPELGLESLLQFDHDDRSSTVESVTSPSDYSGRSGQSPMGSIAGTPAVESASHSTNNRSTSVESAGGYFDGYNKRMSFERSRSSTAVPQSSQKSHAATKQSSWDHRSVLQQVDPSSFSENVSNKRRKEQNRAKERDPNPPARGKSPAKGSVKSTAQTETPEPRHSLLHSHGADFKASFQTLPSATVPKTPGAGHTRTASSSENFAMPPPSERLLRIIIDGLPVQIFTAAPLTGRLTWVNSKLLQYRGLSAESILDDPWGGIHPEDREEYLEGWSWSLHTGKQFQQKVRLRRYDDTYRYFYVRASPLRTNEQRIVHWFGTMFDLHDQHVAEVNASRQQETAASEAKYRALANSSPQIVFAVNPKRGVSFCNTQWTAYSGQTEEEAKGAGFMDHVYPDDLEKCKLPSFEEDGSSANNVPISIPPGPRRTPSSSSQSSDASGNTVTSPTISSTGIQMPQRRLSELASTGILRVSRDATGKPSYSTEVRLRSKSGEYRWHLVRVLLADPLIQSEAQEETWYGTCTDINDHKELEQTLKETMDAKSRFLSNMSHEIRTPLNGIWGMTNFLIDSKLSGEQLDQVNVIRSSTEGLRDLINDILDLSKVEAGMITLTMDWLNIRSVIEEVNDLTSSLSLDKGIELNYLVDSNVPSVLKGDKFRCRQVLLNVIGNAIKFTEEGEVFVHCTALHDTANNTQDNSIFIQIEVRDTGTGFSEEEAERLFKRFSQIDGSSTRQHGGSGLGLVISMQLVELHGGTMTATSSVGKGSNFSFTLKFGLPSDTDALSTISGSSYTTPLEQPGEKATEQGSPSQDPPQPSSQTTFGSAVTDSPSAYTSLSPSSAGSDQSVQTVKTSLGSSRSSQSSRASADIMPMNLELNADDSFKQKSASSGADTAGPFQPSGNTITSKVSVQPPLYSILVVCPMPWMREATVEHLESILAKNVAHKITARESYEKAQALIAREDFVFTHVVLAIQNTDETFELINQVFQLSSTSTSVVVISDVKQRNDIAYRKTPYDLPRLVKENRLQFIQKPIKPSKLAVIFDPSKSTELSTDQNQSSAQQIAMSQKRLFEEMTRRLGDKDLRVLLVEDNPINQMVMLKLLQRVSIGVETVLDGVQATEKVLAKPAGHYSIILMDLMMPNKDGYETCQDIRTWEKQNKYPPIPIVALSANVLDDVWRKCQKAGFNSYLTKPVEFRELSDVMTAFLDPEDPSKPLAFMKSRGGVVPRSVRH